MKALGQHLLIELFDCNERLLDDPVLVKEAVVSAAQEADATIIETVLHQFSPQGVSGVVLIAESHIAVHTWPEHGYAAVDVFTCSDVIDPYEIMELLARKFSARQCESTLVERGLSLKCDHSKVLQM